MSARADARSQGCRLCRMPVPADARPVGCQLWRMLTVADADGGGCWSPEDAGAQRMLHVPAGAGAVVGSGWVLRPAANAAPGHGWVPGRFCPSQAQLQCPRGPMGAAERRCGTGTEALYAAAPGATRSLCVGPRHPVVLPGTAGMAPAPAPTWLHPGPHRAPRDGGCWGAGGPGQEGQPGTAPRFLRRKEAGCGPCPARPGGGPGGDSGMTQRVALLGRADMGRGWRGWRGQAGMKRMRRIGRDRQG